MKNVVFIDRDGTIVREPRDRQIDALEKMEFIPGIISGLQLLSESGFTLVMVSNQDGLGTKRYPRKAFDVVQTKILTLLEGEGIYFKKIFICPHMKEQHCQCRKPKLGLLKEYLKRHRIDHSRSFVLGDRETDVEFASNLGVKSVRLTKTKNSAAAYVTNDALDACRYIARSIRTATIERVTNETTITASVALDGMGKHSVVTGIGFFDHMLAQLSRHSRIDITLAARGDLHIDEHHTVEDVGIVLGTALRQALGKKHGIERFGFYAPLDESLARVSVDLSGRRSCSFVCRFSRDRVGELPTELVEDFFRAFADGLGATIHISCQGRNDHHKVEAIFKSVALTLRDAVRIDKRRRNLLPTTKGML
jgi:imidazoleglycerol-phosphate dehydratase/histidinol-phosphatase